MIRNMALLLFLTARLQGMLPDLQDAIVMHNIIAVKECLAVQRLTHDEQLQLWQIASDQVHRSNQELAKLIPTPKRFVHLLISGAMLTTGMLGIFNFFNPSQHADERAEDDFLRITQSGFCLVFGFNKFMRTVSNESGKQEYATAIAIQKLIEDYRQPRLQEADL